MRALGLCPTDDVVITIGAASAIFLIAPLTSDQDAANLFFQLISSRYKHASLILMSNLPFSSPADFFGDQAVAAAIIDRIV